MNETQAKAVTSKQNDSDQMGELIRIDLAWERKCRISILCTMLCNSNYDVWADQMEANLKPEKSDYQVHI